MVQSFAHACSFSIATLQWHTPVPGLGPELCHDRSHACLGFPRPWYRRCVTVALGVPSVMVSGLASGSGTRAPLWPILPSTDTRVVSVVLRVNVLRSTHNSITMKVIVKNVWHFLKTGPLRSGLNCFSIMTRIAVPSIAAPRLLPGPLTSVTARLRVIGIFPR